MRLRNVLLLLILLPLGVFAGLNWASFKAPTPLNLLILQTEAPLALIMLIVVVVLTVLYFIFALGLETSALLEARRHARELLAQRKLVEEAEASRYTELKRYLQAELTSLKGPFGGMAEPVVARLEQLETNLQREIEQTGNTLAAYIGELEDRLTGPDRGAR
jgi:hypothetical protein